MLIHFRMLAENRFESQLRQGLVPVSGMFSLTGILP